MGYLYFEKLIEEFYFKNDGKDRDDSEELHLTFGHINAYGKDKNECATMVIPKLLKCIDELILLIETLKLENK